ncbi:4Fe-4S dicluster domain-containing protein, partial [Thermodesulfobacteriota bacterium]
MTLTHPAHHIYLGIPGYVFSWIIFLSAVSLSIYIIHKRYILVSSGRKDPRFTDMAERFKNLVINGFLQKRQPRYLWAGLIHILIFWGFIVLGLRSVDLVSQGLGLPFLYPVLSNGFGAFYGSLKDIFELIVLFACLWAILRRSILKHERYEGSHTFEAYFVLSLIAFLMVTDIFYEGSALIADDSNESFLPASYLGVLILKGASIESLTFVNTSSYWLHIICFFLFLVFLPLGKHFHIITALPNVFFKKLKKGSIKPARWGVDDIEDLDSLGIEKFKDFTWKHILDFLTCTECGRCSDNCPANMVGRPLSPKMVTIKLRDHGQARVPLLKGKKQENNALPIAGGVISHEEIWSCTTCGACEEECPVFIEYIDKIIDMRRHLI